MRLIVFILVLITAIISFSLGGLFVLKTKSQIIYREIAPASIPTKLDTFHIYNLVNDYRVSKGLKKLVFDPRLCDYSEKRLKEIHTDWSHAGFIKDPPFYRYYPNEYTGENLIENYPTDKEVVDAWINSPEHLKNIIDPHFAITCIATDSYNDMNFAVQEFASY